MPTPGSGLYQTNAIISQNRATTQTNASLETKQGTVTKTYGSSNYVSACDVRVLGESQDRIGIPNSTGSQLSVGASVTVNSLRGNPYKSQITGYAGSTSAQLAAQSAINALTAVNSATTTFSVNDGPMLLQSADTVDTPNGYVVEPGSNICLNSTPPTNAYNGSLANGTFTITMKVLVGTSVPTSLNYLDGTLFDLIDSYGNGLGCYRFDATRGKWELRTPTTGGGGTSGVTSLNSETGAINILAGSNITVTPSGQNITIAATGGGSGTVNSGTSGQLAYYASTGTTISGENTLTASQTPAFTGDISTPGGSLATTLATVNSNIGSFTNANITVNGKGLITAAANGGGGGGINPTDYISGLGLSYSATGTYGSAVVSTGTAYVPGGSAAVTVGTALTWTPGSALTASTIYYIYLNSSGALVESTTAPVTNYQGTAWEDSSGRRYLGSILSNASGNIYNFLTAAGNVVFYRTNIVATPFLVYNTTVSGSANTISLASLIPATSRIAKCLAQTHGNGAQIYFGSSDGAIASSSPVGSNTVVGVSSSVNGASQLDLVLNSSQALTAAGGGAGSPTLQLSVIGYIDQR